MSSTMLNHNQHFNTHPLVKLVLRDSEIYHCILGINSISNADKFVTLYTLCSQGWAKTCVFHQKPSPVGLTALNQVLMGFTG